jgi:hypothetical protein
MANLFSRLGGKARSQGIRSQGFGHLAYTWILLRGGLYPRFNAGSFIYRSKKESVVREQYADNTYGSHET